MLIPKNRNEDEVLPRVPESIGSGTTTVTTAGTRVQLTTTVTPCFYVIIAGKTTNVGYIFIGGTGVSATSGIMIAALQSVRIDIDDLSKIWIDTDTSGEGVQYSYVAP